MGILLDKESLHFLPAKGEKATKRRVHFFSAIEIGNLSAGQMLIDNQSARLVLPRPCVMQYRKGFEESDIKVRGIKPEAARALLDLAQAANNPIIEPAKGKWKFGGAAERDAVGTGWDQWRFVAAWRWSVWGGFKRRERWQDLRSFGYPYSEGAFGKMMTKDLKLVTVKREQR